MPTAPISMRKLKEILRLKYGAGLSHRQIGRSLAISPSVVSRYANRALGKTLLNMILSSLMAPVRFPLLRLLL